MFASRTTLKWSLDIRVDKLLAIFSWMIFVCFLSHCYGYFDDLGLVHGFKTHMIQRI